MSQKPTREHPEPAEKPLVVKCRVTLPRGVDLFSFYSRFADGKFTVLRKGDLVPRRDGTGDNFYMDVFIWPEENKEGSSTK